MEMLQERLLMAFMGGIHDGISHQEHDQTWGDQE
jgi:hypothetical protein